MKRCLWMMFALVIFSETLCSAQLTGKWTGKLIVETANEFSWMPSLGMNEQFYYYELDLKLNGTQVTGYSITQWGNDYAKVRVEGFFDGKMLKVKETKIIEERTSGNTVWCFLHADLEISYSNGMYYLKGPWRSYNIHDGSPCGPGKIVLSMKMERA